MKHFKATENFPNSPIRRTYCVIICESEDCLHLLCSVHSFEGKRFIDKLYLFLKNIKKLLKLLEDLSKSKESNWTSYETVTDNIFQAILPEKCGKP